MTAALLTLAMLAQPEARISRPQARALASVALAAEARHGLPGGLLVAVALGEHGGARTVARNWKARKLHSCDVGPWGLNIPGCPSAIVGIVRRAPLGLLADEAARLLKLREDPSEKLISGNYTPENQGDVGWLQAAKIIVGQNSTPSRCPWWKWNSRSPGWCAKILDIHRRLLSFVEASRVQPTS